MDHVVGKSQGNKHSYHLVPKEEVKPGHPLALKRAEWHNGGAEYHAYCAPLGGPCSFSVSRRVVCDWKSNRVLVHQVAGLMYKCRGAGNAVCPSPWGPSPEENLVEIKSLQK